MERIMKKDEIVDELASRTNFFKKNIRDIVDALQDIIVEHFETAEIGANSEFYLAPGIVLVGVRKPAGEAKNPKTGETVLSPEKVIPKVTFKTSLRQKLYNKSKYYKKKKDKKG